MNCPQLPETALQFLHQSLGNVEITMAQPTSTGMTNRSFRLRVAGDPKEYLLRVPGEGTERLLSRRQEAETYRTLNGDPISDQVLALDPASGYKLTAYWQGTRNCDPENPAEVRQCMDLLRAFHQKHLTVPHRFDLYEELTRYETLMGGKSVHPDYKEVRGRCQALRGFLDRQEKQLCLTHVDAVPDNFLFVPEPGGETLHLIDWEYAGMNDPHLDIAMFAIYAGYDKKRLDQLIDWYFVDGCSPAVRTKIYCYVALSGLLWSNWCEYKKALGVDFGDYAESQYRYAAEYSRLVLGKEGQ
jgi:thiamine kinase-like enzyme